MKRSIEIEEKDELWHRIALKCYEHFRQLGSRGKPSTNEWTHLAAFVVCHRDRNDCMDIVSMGTGTKCLGKQIEERGVNGCLLHDSHAEVIAKRSFQRFLYESIQSNDQSLFISIDQEKNHYQLKESIDIYLFVSYPPCGAAASLDDPIKRPKLEHKLLHSLGKELVLKPGKGSPTSSLSCTNKINRWIYQGFSFLSFLSLIARFLCKRSRRNTVESIHYFTYSFISINSFNIERSFIGI